MWMVRECYLEPRCQLMRRWLTVAAYSARPMCCAWGHIRGASGVSYVYLVTLRTWFRADFPRNRWGERELAVEVGSDKEELEWGGPSQVSDRCV